MAIHKTSLFNLLHHLSRRPRWHDKHTYISCNVIRFINATEQNPEERRGRERAMCCLHYQDMWGQICTTSCFWSPVSLNSSLYLSFPFTSSTWQRFTAFIFIECLSLLSSKWKKETNVLLMWLFLLPSFIPNYVFSHQSTPEESLLNAQIKAGTYGKEDLKQFQLK